MEFNNIKLPPFVVAGLYKHTLVLLDGEIAVDKQAVGGLRLQDEIIVGSWRLADDGKKVEHRPLQMESVAAIPEKKHALVFDTAKQAPFLPDPLPADPELPTIPIDPTPNVVHPASNIAHPTSIKFLGGFTKKITVVLEDHFHPDINDGDLVFLTKLLQACQLSLNDVAIVNVVSNGATSNQLWQLMPSQKMIMFDIDPGTLGLPFRLSHFKLQPWSDCVFLASPSLEALQKDASEKVVQLKRNLWESLKKMFLA